MNKKEIYQLLEKGFFQQLLIFFDQNPGMVRKYVTMATLVQDEKIRRPAIEFFGFLAEKEEQ